MERHDRQEPGNYSAWHEAAVAKEDFLHKLVLKEGRGTQVEGSSWGSSTCKGLLRRGDVHACPGGRKGSMAGEKRMRERSWELG